MSSLTGEIVSQGIVIGQARVYRDFLHEDFKDEPVSSNPEEEQKRLERAIEKLDHRLDETYQNVKLSLGEEEAEIFRSHQQILEDPGFVGEIKKGIEAGTRAEKAVQQVTRLLSEQFKNLDDEYLQQRAADMEDIGRQLIEFLMNNENHGESSDYILCGTDIPPSEFASSMNNGILGMVMEEGTGFSHTSILAKAKGLPSLVKVEGLLENVQDGDRIILDALDGHVVVNPDENTLKKIQEIRSDWENKKQKALEKANEPCITADHKTISIFANAGSVQDVRAALENGAEGVGLFRTEFIFLNRKEAPSEEEQYQIYSEVLKMMKDKPVIIRTLDIGGDKDVPYMNLPDEENPFLGLRGIRYCLENQEIFKAQLRALLRSAHHGNLYIMIPMISMVEEVREVKTFLNDVMNELTQEDEIFEEPRYKLGIMVEVPSVVETIDHFVQEVDFFSIGSNDLVQYLFAADRIAPNVKRWYDVQQIALYRMIEKVVAAARDAGKEIGVCGELANNQQIAQLLVSLGVEKLSMSPAQIPMIKSVIRKLHAGDLFEKWEQHSSRHSTIDGLWD